METNSLCLCWTIKDVHRKISDEDIENKTEEEEIQVERLQKWGCFGPRPGLYNKYIYFLSKEFPLPGYNFGARARIDLSTMRIYIQFRDIYNTKRPLDIKSLPMFTYIRKDVDRDDLEDVVVQADWIFDWKFYKKERFNEFGYVNYDLARGPSRHSVIGDVIQITILVEPPSVVLASISNNGKFVWKIDNFSKTYKRLLESGKVERSPYFYSAPKGYRMVCKLYVGRKETSVFFTPLKGEYDDMLADDFKATSTVTLINHKDPSNTLVKSSDWSKCDCVDLIKNELIESQGFVYNDSITLEIEVKCH